MSSIELSNGPLNRVVWGKEPQKKIPFLPFCPFAEEQMRYLGKFSFLNKVAVDFDGVLGIEDIVLSSEIPVVSPLSCRF